MKRVSSSNICQNLPARVGYGAHAPASIDLGKSVLPPTAPISRLSLGPAKVSKRRQVGFKRHRTQFLCDGDR
jgi:hypothetical protein